MLSGIYTACRNHARVLINLEVGRLAACGHPSSGSGPAHFDFLKGTILFSGSLLSSDMPESFAIYSVCRYAVRRCGQETLMDSGHWGRGPQAGRKWPRCYLVVKKFPVKRLKDLPHWRSPVGIGRVPSPAFPLCSALSVIGLPGFTIRTSLLCREPAQNLQESRTPVLNFLHETWDFRNYFVRIYSGILTVLKPEEIHHSPFPVTGTCISVTPPSLTRAYRPACARPSKFPASCPCSRSRHCTL
jgi:hypothetical protein